MTPGDRGARRTHVGAVGQLQALALAPDAFPQDRKVENFDAHGGGVYLRLAVACKPLPDRETPTFRTRA
jgi:hypothetical protein